MTQTIHSLKERFSGREGALRLLKLAAVAGAVLFSLGWALRITRTSEMGHSPDAEHYIAMAERLVTQGTYSFWGGGPDAYVPPGYPLFVALCMALFGVGESGIGAVRVIQCVLAAGTVLLTFLVGRRATGKYAVGLIAALLIACHGTYYYYSQRVLTETLYFFAMMLFFLVFLRARQKGGLPRHLLAGACLAAAVMIRPLVVILLPFLYLPHLWKNRRDPKAAWIPFLCFLGGFTLVCLPWWIRNLVSLHRFIPLATQTNPIFAGLAPDVAALGLTDPGSMLGNVALFFRLLRQDPVSTLHWMTLGKFRIIFLEAPPYSPVVLTTIIRDATVYLGLFGSLTALGSRENRWPALLFWIYLASSFLFVPTARYALQYFPLMAIFGAWMLCTAWEEVRREDART